MTATLRFLRPARGRRDAELEARLREHGVLARRRRGGVAPADRSAFVARLREALTGAAPLHRAFCRYLADRVDLLPPADGERLARVPQRVQPLPPDEVLHLVEAQLPGVVGELLGGASGIDPEPLASGPFRQVHAARTVGGRAVELVVVRPYDPAELSAARLAPLADGLDSVGLPGEEVVAGFLRRARLARDLEAEAELLAELAAEAEGVPGWKVPAVVVDGGRLLAAPECLLRAALPGRTANRHDPPSPADLARLSALWVRQAHEGSAYPLDPVGDEVRLLGGGRVAWTGGPFAVLPAASQRQVWRYLAAAAEADATSACDHLLAELVRGPEAVAESELVLRLRQVVPFRDGGLLPGTDPLAEELFAAFRVARECGYLLRRPLADLAAALAPLVRAGRRWAPGQDVVRRAVLDRRLERSAEDLRQQWTPASLAALPAPYARSLMEMPRKLDAALELLQRGQVRVRLERTAPARPARRGLPWGRPAVAAVAVALVLPRLAEIDGVGWGWWPVLLLALLLFFARRG